MAKKLKKSVVKSKLPVKKLQAKKKIEDTKVLVVKKRPTTKPIPI